MVTWMEKGFYIILMVIYTKEILKIVKRKEKELCIILMEINIMEISKMVLKK